VVGSEVEKYGHGRENPRHTIVIAYKQLNKLSTKQTVAENSCFTIKPCPTYTVTCPTNYLQLNV